MSTPLTLCTVNYNTSRFIELMLFSVSRLTRNAWKLLVCDNGSSAADQDGLRRVCASCPAVEIFWRKQSRSGSIGHAEALDFLVSKVDTPYFATMDADCVFLRRDWDVLFLDRMRPPVACVGTPPTPHPDKPSDFPYMFATLYDTAVYRNLDSPSFMPDVTWVDAPNKSGLENRDTGWMVRKTFLENGYRGAPLSCVNTRYAESRYYNNICAEYYLPDDPTIVCCHFGRGATQGRAKTKALPFWYSLPWAGEWLQRRRCRSEVKEWIERSRAIVLEATGENASQVAPIDFLSGRRSRKR